MSRPHFLGFSHHNFFCTMLNNSSYFFWMIINAERPLKNETNEKTSRIKKGMQCIKMVKECFRLPHPQHSTRPCLKQTKKWIPSHKLDLTVKLYLMTQFLTIQRAHFECEMVRKWSELSQHFYFVISMTVRSLWGRLCHATCGSASVRHAKITT